MRLYQQVLGCSGEGADIDLYRIYAGQLRSGAAASPDFRPEYPPGALTLFTLPMLVGGDQNYPRTFAAMMALFDLAGCLLVFHRARLRPPVPPSGPLFYSTPFFHATLYLLITAAVWPILHARFDVVPAVLALAALHCLDRHRERLSAVLLGVAGAVKLWPFALFPIWIARGLVTPSRPLRRALVRLFTIGVLVAAGALIVSLPVLPLIGDRILSSARYHVDRGLEIESTWSTIALVMDRLGFADTRPEEAYGSLQIAGRLPSMFAKASLPATLVLVGIPVIALFVRERRRNARNAEPGLDVGQDDDRGDIVEVAALGIILGSMLAAKVLSPQFILWIAPLLALVVKGPVGAAVALLTAGLTSEVFPGRFTALADNMPGHGRAIIALAVRNALLIGWYVMAIRRLTKQPGRAHRLDGGAGTLPGPILPLRRSGQGRPGR